jgi:serine/threonine protein kinase
METPPPAKCIVCYNPGVFRCHSCHVPSYCSQRCYAIDYVRGHQYSCDAYRVQTTEATAAIEEEGWRTSDLSDSTSLSSLDRSPLQLEIPALPHEASYLIQHSPELMRTTYLKFHTESQRALRTPLDPLDKTQSLELSETFVPRFETMRMLSHGKYGTVLSVYERNTATNQIQETVMKIEPLQYWLRDPSVDPSTGTGMELKYWSLTPNADLISNIVLSRLPRELQRNVVIFLDWTRARFDAAEFFEQYPATHSQFPIQAQPGVQTHQLMLFERAEGTAYQLIEKMGNAFISNHQHKLAFAKQYLVQIWSTLAMLNHRHGIQHNDLSIFNILYSTLSPEHHNRAIFYQLPKNPHCWMFSHLSPLNNCILKLADFGLCSASYVYTDRSSDVPISRFGKVSPFPEFDDDVVASRFDFIWSIQVIYEMFKLPELLPLIDEVKSLLLDPSWEEGSSRNIKRLQYLYEPELLLLKMDFFKDNRMCNISPATIEDLRQKGSIIVPSLPITPEEVASVN